MFLKRYSEIFIKEKDKGFIKENINPSWRDNIKF